jgi:aryl-phospho-beta-D-glucosidase BglC (GH1 family)
MGTNGQPGHLADKNGKVVILHGVDESGSENFCFTWGPPAVVFSPAGGPSPLNQASLTAMKSWGINAVRIPMNEACWLGINGVGSAAGGPNYQSAIAQVVDLITNTNGMAVILDLHLAGPGTSKGAMGYPSIPDMDHSVTFWQQVASAYKGNGNVIFDLYNEPNLPGTPDQQYQCWKNGSTAPNSGDCAMVNYAVAGMQTLVNTVRQAGANNLIILGGTGVAALMQPWAKYVPTDTLSPPNLAASWHVYDDQGGCTSNAAQSLQFLCPTTALGGVEGIMAAGYPILVGETGYYSCSQAGVGTAWWPFFLSWATAHQIGTVAWAWSNSNTPALLSDTTNFTPNANGQIYKNFLSCIASKTVTPLTTCTAIPSTGCE